MKRRVWQDPGMKRRVPAELICVSKATSRSSFHLMDFSSGAAALGASAAPVRSTSGACASEGTCEKRAVRLVDGRWLQLG